MEKYIGLIKIKNCAISKVQTEKKNYSTVSQPESTLN